VRPAEPTERQRLAIYLAGVAIFAYNLPKHP
jgi:hypothetical protein